MAVDSTTIAGYFDRLGWTYKVSDERRVLTGFHTRIPYHYLPVAAEVITTQHWVVLRALVQRNVRAGQRQAVQDYVSLLNERVYLARFVFSRDCVVLQGEIPVSRSDLGSFRELLMAITKYSALAGLEIATLATNPSTADLFNSVRTALSSPLGATINNDLDLDFDLSVNRLPENLGGEDGM